jgi:hypothetical protein
VKHFVCPANYKKEKDGKRGCCAYSPEIVYPNPSELSADKFAEEFTKIIKDLTDNNAHPDTVKDAVKRLQKGLKKYN